MPVILRHCQGVHTIPVVDSDKSLTDNFITLVERRAMRVDLRARSVSERNLAPIGSEQAVLPLPFHLLLVFAAIATRMRGVPTP
jgi:hypothetical protein